MKWSKSLAEHLSFPLGMVVGSPTEEAAIVSHVSH
jgi:hypothetical protein